MSAPVQAGKENLGGEEGGREGVVPRCCFISQSIAAYAVLFSRTGVQNKAVMSEVVYSTSHVPPAVITSQFSIVAGSYLG